MIRSFKDQGTYDIFDGTDSRSARSTCPVSLWAPARERLDRLYEAKRLTELREPPGNRLESLRGKRFGQFSIRINNKYRVCFRWRDGAADDVEIVDYH